MSFSSGSSLSIDMTDQERFAIAKQSLDSSHLRYNIGTYMERSQHLLLKLFYEPDISYHEVPFEGYIADILNNDGITEIQTVGFRALHDKLTVFLPHYPVRVVYPVDTKNRICWIDPDSGESTYSRLATYKKERYKILPELLHISDMFGCSGLSVELASMSVSTHKLLDGYGKDRKRRATKKDVVPEELIEITVLRNSDDIRDLLPFEKGQRLTSKEIGEALGLNRRKLWMAIKFLCITEVLIQVDKKGNSIIYEMTPHGYE